MKQKVKPKQTHPCGELAQPPLRCTCRQAVIYHFIIFAPAASFPIPIPSFPSCTGHSALLGWAMSGKWINFYDNVISNGKIEILRVWLFFFVLYFGCCYCCCIILLTAKAKVKLRSGEKKTNRLWDANHQAHGGRNRGASVCVWQ